MDSPQLSRRGLFGLTGAAVAAGSVGATTLATPAVAAASGLSPATLLGSDPLPHLLRRATYGVTPDLLAEARTLGAKKWLDQQLNPATISDPVQADVAALFPHLTRSIATARKPMDYAWDLMYDVSAATLMRATWSKRQLFEVMVEFWSNHLNITCPASPGWDCRHRYDIDVIRKYAFGRFEDMLLAAIEHPAMLSYLNNTWSSKSSPNENLGRELLELHTVGVGAGYGETGVRQSALILTGLSRDEKTGNFRYRPEMHYTGSVHVLGFRHTNRSATRGQDVVTAYLRYLAHHPATAKRIATKLATRFVSDNPPASLVATLASTYLKNKTAIVPVLRALFASKEFAAAIGVKTKTPYEDHVSTLRTLGSAKPPTRDVAMQLLWQSGSFGQQPLFWGPPNGYPDVAAAWANPNTTLGRLNGHTSLSADWWPKLGIPAAVTELEQNPPATYGDVVDRAAQRIVYRPVRDEHKTAILSTINRKPEDAVRVQSLHDDLREFIVPMLLHSPYHTAR